MWYGVVCRQKNETDARRSSKDLSPVAEAPARGEGSPIGVTRSRTLPSTRSGRSGHTERSVPSAAAAAATTTSAAIVEGAPRPGRTAEAAGTEGRGAAAAAEGRGEGRGAATDDEHEHEHEHERHGRVLKKPRPSSAQPASTSTPRGKGGARSPAPAGTIGTKDVGAPVQGSLVGSANVGKDVAAAPGGGSGAPPVQPIEGVPTPVQGQQGAGQGQGS